VFSFALPNFLSFAFSPRDDERVSSRGQSGADRLENAIEGGVRESSIVDDAASPPRTTLIGDRAVADVLGALGSANVDVARDALATIYQAYFETLWHFAYRHTHSQDTAKELVHDVFLTLWSRRATVVITGELIGYLRGAVRHLAYKTARHASVVARMESSIDSETYDAAQVPGAGTVMHPEAALEHAEADRMLREAMAAIAPRDRDVLTMRWVDRMTHDEIGAVLGISNSRVRTILARATARVAPAFQRLRGENAE